MKKKAVRNVSSTVNKFCDIGVNTDLTMHDIEAVEIKVDEIMMISLKKLTQGLISSYLAGKYL